MSKIGLIVAREWNERVRKKSFVVTTLLTPLLMVGMIALVSWLSSRGADSVKFIEVVDRSGFVAAQLENQPDVVFRTTAEGVSPEDAMCNREEDTWGILIIGEDVMTNGAYVELYSFGPSTMEVEQAIRHEIERVVEERKLEANNLAEVRRVLDQMQTTVNVRAYMLDENGARSSVSSVLSYAVSYVFGFLMYMFVLIYGSQVMTGVIEEKNNRVLEVMVSSVRPMELMMGKILGVAAVAVTQFSLWVVLVLGLGSVVLNLILPEDLMEAARMGGVPVEAVGGGADEMAQVLSLISEPTYLATIIGGFLLFFVGGYLLYAAMFAAVGSAVGSATDSNQFQNLVTMPIIVALVVMFGVIIESRGGKGY